MIKKSIFNASFRESLRLKNDNISGTFMRDNLKSAQEKERFRGTKQSYTWITLLTFLFIIGPNWLIVFLNNYLIKNYDASKYGLKISGFNFLPYWLFWLMLSLWLGLIWLGKRFKYKFILIYRGQFHIYVSFIVWIILELNLFLLTMFYSSLGVTTFIVLGLLLIFTLFLLLNSRIDSLHRLIYEPRVNKSVNRFAERGILFIKKYGCGLLALGIVIRMLFLRNSTVELNWFSTAIIVFIWFLSNVLIFAFEIYFIFPFMLQGYYKLKYPEDYRKLEGKSHEDWY